MHFQVGVVKDIERLKGLFDLFAEILHQLCRIGSAYEEDPGVALGGVLRVGPMFALGRRFTRPRATQEGHRLVTTGFDRFIRHPSYLGALLGGIGWVLVFRSGIGLLLILLLVPFTAFVIPAEEALLRAEFGEEYEACRQRTWRMMPFVY